MMNIILKLFAQTDFDVDDSGLDTIELFFFDVGDALLPSAEATFFSWLAWFGAVGSIGLIIFWTVLLLRAAFQALKSEDNSEELGESYKKIKSLFIGLGLSILFPVILTIVGTLFGLGNFYNWPQALEACNAQAISSTGVPEVDENGNPVTYQFYFLAALDGQEDRC